ncbi:MAG: fumarylacetoacetate hydrolase family protein [Alphaproteobacteria bacterium]
MKLGSLRDGSLDGMPVVVSRDLATAVSARIVVANWQLALEHWADTSPALEALYGALNSGTATGVIALQGRDFESPLPRAYQFLDGSAYLNHAERVRRARGAEMPESFRSDPMMYQGLSDRFLGPTDDILAADEAWGIDFEAEIGVIVDRVPMGIAARDAAAHILLVVLLNDVSLRNLIPGEVAKSFGFIHGKPASAFAPVAVTPDTLGPAWDGGRLHGPVRVDYNGESFGRTDAGKDMNFDFPALIAHAAKTRSLAAGTIIGSGTVSNRDRDAGSSCIAERRMIETIDFGAPKTPFMAFGDRVRIEMTGADGQSIFGAIDQRVRQA